METNRVIIMMGIAGIIVAAIIVFIVQTTCSRPSHQHTIYKNYRYQTELEIKYNNNTKDTVNILVDRYQDNIRVEYGNLTYWQYPIDGDNWIKKVSIASYVKKFEILNSVLITDTLIKDCYKPCETYN